MYYLTNLESKLLRDKLMRLSREVGVTAELRGYNWANSPVKPYYDDVFIPMYLITSKYCPTNRDVFINKVLNKRGKINYKISLGLSIHKTVSILYQYILDDAVPDFEDWIRENEKYIYYPGITDESKERIKGYMRLVWDYILAVSRTQILNTSSEQPYIRKRDLLMTSVPFLIEHKVSGNLLGLSGVLSIDCFDYLRNIVFDLKVVDNFNNLYEWFRLSPTGYAMVLESVYEIPIDYGCVVYVSFMEDRLLIKRDLFFISNDLRSWWIEERDKKLEIIAERKDPGTPIECYKDCIYRDECGIE